MSDPRMRVEALKRYKGVHPVNTSLNTRSSRENSVVAENSSENGIVEREKMKRKWNLAYGERIRPGALTYGGGGSFIADPPFTFLLIVGENVAERTGAARLGRDPCNCPDARIFASRGAGGRAHLCACACGRVHLWAHAGRNDARMSWTRASEMHASLGACKQGRVYPLGARMYGLCSCTWKM